MPQAALVDMPESELFSTPVVLARPAREDVMAPNCDTPWRANYWSSTHDYFLFNPQPQAISSTSGAAPYLLVYLLPASIWVPLASVDVYHEPPQLYNTELAGPTRATTNTLNAHYRTSGWDNDILTTAGLTPSMEVRDYLVAYLRDRFPDWRRERFERRESACRGFKRNLADFRTDRLLGCSDYYYRQSLKDSLARLGKLVRDFVRVVKAEGVTPTYADFDYSTFVEYIGRVHNNVAPSRAVHAFDAITNADDRYGDGALHQFVFRCDISDEFVLSRDAIESNYHGERYSPACEASGTVVWSEVMGDYIRRSRAVRWFESASEAYHGTPTEWVIGQWARDNDYYSVEGGYCTEDTYYDYRDRYESDDDDDDDCDDNDGLSSYHTGRRDFTERVAAGAFHPALGVELEVWAEDRRAAVMGIRRATNHLCESDSSLCEIHGFEIITAPYGKPEWEDQAKQLLRTCSDEEIKGYNAQDGQYGIHVTVHRRHLSPLQEARMMMFMTATENGDFVKTIAQRMMCFGEPRWDMGVDARDNRRIVDGPCGYLNRGKYDPAGIKLRTKGKSDRCDTTKIQGVGKYAPICWKQDLAEFRVFQSTTHAPSFLKNLEFVWALIEWTSTSTCSGTAWHHEAFVKWLAARPRALKDYPHLIEYLQRKQYIVKGSRGTPIHNTWLPILLSGLRRSSELAEVDEELAEDTEYAEAA